MDKVNTPPTTWDELVKSLESSDTNDINSIVNKITKYGAQFTGI